VDILFCTDGSSSSIQAADITTKFGFAKTTKVNVLAVSEGKDDIKRINNSLNEINQRLESQFSVSTKVRHGDPIEEILAEALDHQYDLVIVGGGGNQIGLLHPKVGSTTGKLARKLHTHFLVVRNIPEQFQKVLFCTGAEAPASETMNLGGKWISKTTAQVGILHVVQSSQAIAEVDSGQPGKPQDKLIERSTSQLRDAGVKAAIEPRIRNGLVVEEVLKELSEGSYELLVVGSHYQPGQNRWQGTLLDDITDQLLNRSTCSVLII
jgi:nucleotide-binding universal stress UspA family protein